MQLQPDGNNDWINQRDAHYSDYPSLVSENGNSGYFNNSSAGIMSACDSWIVGFNNNKIDQNTRKLILHFNDELECKSKNVNYKINTDPHYIKWNSKLKQNLKRNNKLVYDSKKIRKILYRPFTKKWIYYDKEIVERPRELYKSWGNENIGVCTTGKGINRPFSTLITDELADYQLLMNCQDFILKDNSKPIDSLFEKKDLYNLNRKYTLSREDTLAFIYGVMNSKGYQKKYANDLKKEIARIPIVKNKKTYVEIGKKLMDLHLNYEEVPAYEKLNLKYQGTPDYKVKKMKFAKKRNSEGKLEKDKSTIIFNDTITIENIPEKAYEYIVNGRSAIEWIMDQYQVKKDKKSGITDDPNEFSDDPKYIFNLLLSIINVSVQTVDLINQLPKLEIEE